MEDQLAAGSRRVDALLQTLEPDVTGHETPHRFHQVRERAAQTVELPDDQGVSRPTALERIGQPRPLRLGATGGIREDAPAAGGQERVLLKVKVLVGGRDSGIADKHGSRPFW